LAPAQEPIFASEASKNGFASSAQSASSSLVSGKPRDIRRRRNSRCNSDTESPGSGFFD